MNGITHQQAPQELAQRISGGIEVTLLWSAFDNELTVHVMDHVAGEGLEMAVDPARANHAFRHPYVYGAEQGLEYQGRRLSAA
jgi:hypothetical protein